MVIFCCADALIANSAASRRLSQILNFKTPLLGYFPACTSYLKCAEARFTRCEEPSLHWHEYRSPLPRRREAKKHSCNDQVVGRFPWQPMEIPLENRQP